MPVLNSLLNLHIIFWSGWILSAFLLLCFLIAFREDRLSEEESFSDSTPSSLYHLSLPKLGPSIKLMATLAVLFGVTFISRYWLRQLALGPWFFADEAVDNCIIPFQIAHGESIWGGTTYNLVHFIRLISYRLFGFSPEVAQTTNILYFAGSVACFHWALQRPFGNQVAWFVTGMMLLGSPFIVHSIYATLITFCLLPTGILLWILTRPLNQASAAFLGVVVVAGLYLYPAAFLTGICVILFHAIVFYRSWIWKTRLISLITFVFSAGLARLLLTGNPT